VSLPHDDAVRARFGENAALVAEHAARQVERAREELRAFLSLHGDERILDAGTGAGTLALALAPLVHEVVGVDLVPELLEAARRGAPPNATFVEGDATHLPFEDASVDLAASRRTLHHVARPELAVAELARVIRPGGHVFVDDQIAPADPLAALELDRFERARDPAHARTLPDVDLRHLFEANSLVLERYEHRTHRRELGFYLELAGCRGEEAERVRALSPDGPNFSIVEVAWYLLRKPL
jgi:ubiquinone/menaquinone biosynthesis C-methylase UbiE